MNANLKSGNALVRFLLRHGEKIGILGILICTGLIIWSALGVDRLGERQTPSDLSKILKAVDQKVKASTYQNFEDKVISTPLSEGEAEIKPIDMSHYPRLKYGFNRPILDPIAQRTDPTLFAPEELEAHGDYGLWASANPNIIKQKMLEAMKERDRLMKEESDARDRADSDGGEGRESRGPYSAEHSGRDASGKRRIQKGPIVVRPKTGAQLQGFEDIKARSWVTVLARIPVKKQYLQYDDALQAARGYDQAADIPVYGGYYVERAEITESGQGEWKSITGVPKVTAKTITKEIETYPVNVPDVIDPRVNHPILTHPLPPLILREWDARVSHSSMPLASEIDPYEDETEFEEAEAAEEGSEEDDIFGNPLRAGTSRGGDRRGAMTRRSSGGRRSMAGRGGGYGGGEYGGGEYGGGALEGDFGGGFGAGRGGGRMGAGRGATLDTFVWDQETSHVLLRFFDHTVLAGHRYRYRVRLIVKDVNSNVDEKYLDKTVTERRGKDGKSYRLTDWSKPSSIASVPLPARVYVMTAKPAKETNFTDEAEVNLLVKALNSEFAAEIANSDSFIRGSVINLHNSVVKVIWSSDFDPDQDSEKFSMRTGITLLDFHGGERLSSKNRDLLAPTRALLMDPAGKLFVQSELDDEEGVAEYSAALQQDPKDRRGGRGQGGYGGDEFGGGDYGREF